MNQFENEMDNPQYTRFEGAPNVGSLSGLHQEKVNIWKSSIVAAIGSFVFTFGIIASNGNFLTIMIIFFISILMTNRLTIFNPAVSFMELIAAKITFYEFLFNVGGQFLGSFLGAMTGFFTLGNWVTNVPYLDARLHGGLLGSISGEMFGATLLMCMIIIQEDDYLKISDDKLEHSLIVTLTFGAARILSYTSESLFNPAFAFSLEMFECIKDGNWGRFGFLWVYMVGPFMAAVVAIIFDSQIYKRFYDLKIKHGF